MIKDFFEGLNSLVNTLDKVEFTTVLKITFGISAMALVGLAVVGGSEVSMAASGGVAVVSLIVAGIANVP